MKDIRFTSDHLVEIHTRNTATYRCFLFTITMHRWSRQQAVDYVAKNTGLPDHEIEAEIDRYITLPGQVSICLDLA